MFCKNCGTENEDGAKFCKSCGKILEGAVPIPAAAPLNSAAAPLNSAATPVSPAAASNAAMGQQPKKKKPLLPILIGAGVVIAALIVVIIIINAKPKINLNDYLTIEASGYDGYGTATAIIDWDRIEEDYGDKLSLTGEAESLSFLFTPMDILQLYINVRLEDARGLSNGSTITYTWSVDEDIFDYIKCNIEYHDDTYVVEGLEEVSTFDVFADLEVTFSGISPNGRVEYDYHGSLFSKYDFMCDSYSGLSNGDTVTFSIPDMGAEYYVEHLGIVPTSFEKEYVVSGLEEYVGSYESLSDDFISELRSETEDTIYSYTAGSYSSTSSLTDLVYAGYIFNSVKDNSGYVSAYNELYIIYSGTVSSSNGSFSTSKVYFPVKFANILSGESGLSYDANGGIAGYSYFDGTWNSTRGYINPLTCYIELVEAKRDSYTSECGDGFENYAEYDLITTLADISDEYKEILYADALDRIESYIASSYNGGSEASNIEIFGEILLLAKTQGTDFANNNRYFIIFSATVSNSQNRFDTTTVYFPVEYDGIVRLPGNEYMVTAAKGLVSRTSYFPGSYYSTRGYIDGSEMYSQIITVNRDNFTYEVSENILSFGEESISNDAVEDEVEEEE